MSRQDIQNTILEELKRKNASFVGLFGSFVRDEMTETSDIDVLVEFDDNISLLDFIGIELDLSELLGRKVDMVMKSAVHPKIWPYIQRDLKILYQ